MMRTGGRALRTACFAAFVSLAIVAGCGDGSTDDDPPDDSASTDCMSFCKRTLECDSDSPFYASAQDETDCADQCTELDERDLASGCGAASRAFFRCAESKDICNRVETQDCAEELGNYNDCIRNYCAVADPADLPGECD